MTAPHAAAHQPCVDLEAMRPQAGRIFRQQ